MLKFVTFVLYHPVYLFHKNPTPKVSYVRSVSTTPGLGKNTECNLSMVYLNKRAFKHGRDASFCVLFSYILGPVSLGSSHHLNESTA